MVHQYLHPNEPLSSLSFQPRGIRAFQHVSYPPHVLDDMDIGSGDYQPNLVGLDFLE